MKERVSSLKVVNDTVEPAIGLMTKHNSNCRTKNEKVLQQNLQVEIDRFLLFTNKLFPIYFLSWLNIIENKSRTTKKQHWLPLDFYFLNL
jgi:hypothetical protein